MKLKIILISVFVCIVAVFVMISLGIESAFLTKAVRWTEIVIVLSFFAGLVKFLAKEASSIKYSFRELRESFSSKKTSSVLKDVLSSSAENAKKTKLPGTGTQAQSREEKSRLISKLLNSLIILVSAVATFTLGFINPNQSRYTFENIVREQPDFLTETALVFIENERSAFIPGHHAVVPLGIGVVEHHFLSLKDTFRRLAHDLADLRLGHADPDILQLRLVFRSLEISAGCQQKQGQTAQR